ncbi:focadhesin [Rhincodon typus]|uniref:focadhesin n=1 Tax=Rhincodon typus TaxID=259920 RepID=UPI002030CAEE|nr:focadhesin [Rhincodon typus]
MSEDFKRRFEFQNITIQSQAVGQLVAAVLKEKGSSSPISYSSDQSPALNLLWEKCCSDNVVVRSACSEVLVALVAQNHADFNYVLNGILNLIPSASNVQGLIRSISKLLLMQAQGTDPSHKTVYSCPYAIRNPPHPFVFVLENRPDSWPFLLQQIASIFRQPSKRLNASIVVMMAPFFKYLYCEPSCLRENSELRLSLLQIILQSRSAEEKNAPPLFTQQVLRLFFDLVPHLQVTSLAQVTEATIFLQELSLAFLQHAHFWKSELAQLSLQLLCVCEVSLKITGELSSLIHQIQMIVNNVPDSIPAEEMLVGLSLLLLQTPVCQQEPILNLGKLELLYNTLKFRAQVISILWSHTQSKNSLIACSAYKALSVFNSEEYTVLHLPQQVRPERKHDYESDEMEMNEDEEEEKEEDLSVPGASYMKLLLMTPLPVFSAFEEFLTSLVTQELTVMPRGVYYSALRGGTVRSDQGKTVAGIPNFMLKTYEKNKQPGLKSGLAAGLLLCYDLHVQTDKDGKPINRFLVSRGRSYQQMLAALIHEVPIQPSEWHKSILLTQAWLGFMGRTFHAVLQGRQAELEMQQKHGKDDPEELQYKKFISWLWVRDLLTDVVKSASKDSPVVQGNSILALSGLAVTVAKYESSLPSDAHDAPEIGADILPTEHWISMVVETLLSIVDSHYRPKGRIFPWFQHKSYSGENTASAIARSCAATALTLLAPVFITSRKDSIGEVLGILVAGLPGKQKADTSQAVLFHMGLAAGMFLSRLYEERMSDVSGQKMNLLLMKSLDALEKCCFDTSLEYNTGCILGVGLVLSLMSQSSQTESRVHVSVSLSELCRSLDESTFQSRVHQEVLAYSVACVSVSAFSAGIIQANEAEEIMNKLQSLTEQSQQTAGFAMALGNIVHGLAVCGHGKAEDLSNRLLPAWLKILLAEGCPTMHRLAAVNGLVALVGSESSLIQLKSESIQSSQFQSKMNEVIRAMTQTISFSGVIGLQSNAAYALGHLHLTNMSSSQSRTSVPPDFGYLPERSVIRSATDYVIEAGKKGPERIPAQLVKVLLGPVARCGSSYQYPPVNWASILSPLMRLNFGEDVQQHCIEIAVTQAQTSQSAAMFLGMWVAPPLVYSLNLETRKYLFMSLASWMKHVSEDKLQTFVEVLAVQYFTSGNRQKSPDLCHSILQGLNEAMKVPTQVQHSWSILCKSVAMIFEMLPNEIQVSELKFYVGITKCLSELADTEIDRITQVTKDTIAKSTFVRAYLVSQGRVPLLCLNDVIAAAVGSCHMETVVWILLQSFYQCRLISHQNTGVIKRMEWLLELMGHVRNVAYGSAPMQNADPKEAVGFLLSIVAAVVAAWSDHTIPLMLGVRASWLPWSEEKSFIDCMKSSLGGSSVDSLSVQQCFYLLPQSIVLLLAKEPWKDHTQKFIDWLFNIAECPCEILSLDKLNVIKATLLALRFLPEYRKKAIWTRAYGW